MPFGTEARAIDDGEVCVGNEYYVLIDSWGGMVRAHEAPVSQAGPNFDLFLAQLREAVAGQACSALGLPDAITEESVVDEYLLHFPPCASAGGVSLDMPIDRPIHQLPHYAFCDIIHLTVWAMEIFWNQRKRLAQRVRIAKSLFEIAIDGAGAVGAGLRVVDFRSRPFEFVDSNCDTLHDKLSLYIGLSSFDAALRPGTAHWMLMGKERARQTMTSAVRQHLATMQRIERGDVPSADGLAAAFIAGAPGGASAVLARLAQNLTTWVVMPISGGRTFAARLYWSDGEIKAWHLEHRHVHLRDAAVTLRNYPLPDVIENSLEGRRLDEIIGFPMPCPVRVRSGERPYPGSLVLLLHDVFHPVDLVAGSIGEAIPF